MSASAIILTRTRIPYFAIGRSSIHNEIANAAALTMVQTQNAVWGRKRVNGSNIIRNVGG